MWIVKGRVRPVENPLACHSSAQVPPCMPQRWTHLASRVWIFSTCRPVHSPWRWTKGFIAIWTFRRSWCSATLPRCSSRSRGCRSRTGRCINFSNINQSLWKILRFYNGDRRNNFYKSKTERTPQIFCNFAASYFQILFNGPRRVWRCGAKRIKVEVPLFFAQSNNNWYEKKCFCFASSGFSSCLCNAHFMQAAPRSFNIRILCWQTIL